MRILPVETEVGAGRWPYHGAHPDCWGRPWKGVTLAQNDPRAWENTLAFPGLPTQEEVDAHVSWCHSRNLLGPERIPILWDFLDNQGEPYQQVFWETFGPGLYDVKPYEDDFALWLRERTKAGAKPLIGLVKAA